MFFPCKLATFSKDRYCMIRGQLGNKRAVRIVMKHTYTMEHPTHLFFFLRAAQAQPRARPSKWSATHEE